MSLAREPETGGGRAAGKRWYTAICFNSSWGWTLGLLLLIAAAPIALLMVLQGISQLEQDRVFKEQQLSRETLLAANSQQAIVQAARTVMTVLAATPMVTEGSAEECTRMLARVVERLPSFSHVGRLSPTGQVDCAARTEAIGRDYASYLEMSDITSNVATRLLHGQYKDGAETLRIGVFAPIRDGRGDLSSLLALTLDLETLMGELRDISPLPETTVILVNGRGQPLLATHTIVWDAFSTTPPAGDVREVSDQHSRTWQYSQAPVFKSSSADDSLFVVFARPKPRVVSAEWWFVAGYFVMPVLALLLASLGIWIAAHQIVLRWVSKLRDVALGIGEGNYVFGLDRFEHAPREVRELAVEMHRMARAIAERDRGLNLALDRQQHLSLELHHRVRNNLQMIGSYLGIQSDSMETDEGRSIINKARLRVSVLGMVHRLLYDNGELTTISADQLLGELAALTSRQLVGSEAAFVDCAVEPLPVDIDAAVPLALWAMEALEWSWQRLGEMPHELRFGESDGEAKLEIIVPAPEGDYKLPRLMISIARQLGGRGELLLDEGMLRVKLACPRRNLERKFRAQLIQGSRCPG